MAVSPDSRWEEKKPDDGTKWRFLQHMGPYFAPRYVPLPDHIKFIYDGQEMELSEPTEEVAGFYAKMLDHEYTTKDVFNKNFFKDWRKVCGVVYFHNKYHILLHQQYNIYTCRFYFWSTLIKLIVFNQ